MGKNGKMRKENIERWEEYLDGLVDGEDEARGLRRRDDRVLQGEQVRLASHNKHNICHHRVRDRLPRVFPTIYFEAARKLEN